MLGALSAGADLDDELLAATTDLAPDRLGEAVDALRSAGLVTPSGDAVPVVAAAVTEMAPVADRRRFHARLAAALSDRGAPATRTGEHLAAAGAQGATVAAAYVAAGDATLAEAPSWRRAGTSGHSPPARRHPPSRPAGPRPPRSAATRWPPCAWRTPSWATRAPRIAAVPWRWWRRCCPAGVLAPVVGPLRRAPRPCRPVTATTPPGHCWRRSAGGHRRSRWTGGRRGR